MRLSSMTIVLGVAACLAAACGCTTRGASDLGTAGGTPAVDRAGEAAPASPAAPATHAAAESSLAAEAAGAEERPRPREEVAIFAGGCFWCMETQYEGIPGVRSVVSGYTGGHQENPSYHEVGTGATGHFEAVEIRYDPARIDYPRLLDVFWHSIDPTQADGQFCDIGSSYRSAIFARDSTQRSLAELTKRRIEASGVLRGPIVTPILPARPFYPAEEYHQDYWKKNPSDYHSYRTGCGRDRRLAQIWGPLAAKPTVH